MHGCMVLDRIIGYLGKADITGRIIEHKSRWYGDVEKRRYGELFKKSYSRNSDYLDLDIFTTILPYQYNK